MVLICIIIGKTAYLCETQGPSGSKHGSAKGTPARKRKTSEKNKGRKNSTEGGGLTSSQTTRGGLRIYKVVVLGDGGVGKSALTLQFVSHSFSEYHDPTIEDAYQQQAVIDGEAALLDILDTAGQIEFNAMRDQYMRCGEGFIICYSVTDRHSFQEAVEYKKLINKVRASEDIPLILIGNKCDLQHQRKVTMEEGLTLAQQFGCPFFETSAALRHFVDDAFHTLIREIRIKEKGRNSAEKIHSSKWKRLRSILSVIFKKRSHYSF
ncbi:GTP-binding protein Rit2, putative [Pediculus humanus corporis]|uniref:small monomeric GTPase n=1 Tax=Pediculus humanus subsp. corporis TaxID=121224 RepID=E0VQH6_PEDHC|nr:GTP-binding protein Rit2, putative [Pediculus humanus corporis]EEB15632.1 GTP-binding protein Rit2, putative [Pediculus humanus corporis]